MANTICDGLYFYYMMEEMGCEDFPMPFRVLTDSTTAQTFANGTAIKTTLRHVDQRQQWVRMCRDKRVAWPQHIPGFINLADIGTKFFFKHEKVFERLVGAMFCVAPPTAFSTEPS